MPETATVPCPGVGELPAEEPPYPAIKCRRCGAMLEPDEQSDYSWQVPPHEIPDDLFDCSKCGDTGKLSYRTAKQEPVPVGDGFTIQDMGTSGTRACSCVRDLPAIEGDATWWESETVFSEVFTDTIYPDNAVEVTVDSEVPRDENGRRVVRRGNRYYPTMIGVDGELGLIHAGMADDFADLMRRAADKVREIDDPCEDRPWCHHWHPCECVFDVVGRAAAPASGVKFLSREDRWNLGHPQLPF